MMINYLADMILEGGFITITLLMIVSGFVMVSLMKEHDEKRKNHQVDTNW